MKNYQITFFGKGGHGAEPHEAIDATLICCEFIRKISKYPNVEIISISSGDAFNVISGKSNIIFSTTDVKKITLVAKSLLLFYGKDINFEINPL